MQGFKKTTGIKKLALNVNIIYGNHAQGIDPIRDLAENIQAALLNIKSVKKVSFTKSLIPNEINILVEEFSNAKFCNSLIKFKKKYPDTRLILIITEIPINGSYNNFDNSKSYLKYQKKTDKLISLRLTSFKVYITNKILRILTLLIKIKNIKTIRECIYNNYVNLYFYARFHNTKVLINRDIFNKVYIINSSSNNLMQDAFNQTFEEFPYYIELEFLKEKYELIFFSGTKTKERINIFDYIESFGVSVNKNFDFNDEKRNCLAKKSLFSLHVSRYQGEIEYSSPTRTLQALKYGALTLPFKEYSESSLEKMLGILTLTKLIESSKSSNLQIILRSHYFERIQYINTVYKSINDHNNSRLQEIIN